MLNRGWWMALLGLIVMIQPANAETKRLMLGQAVSGHIVLYGNLMPDSLYTLEAQIEVNGQDTTYTGLLINGYARKWTPPKKFAALPVNDRFELEQQVLQARQARLSSLSQPPSTSEMVQFTADQYRASDLVRMVTVNFDSSDASWVITVCYYGSDDDCEGLRFRTGPPIMPPSRSQLLAAEARDILTYLRAGRIVFLGTGILYSPKNRQTNDVAAAVRAARRGETFDRSILPINRLLADLEHPPVTLDALRVSESSDE